MATKRVKRVALDVPFLQDNAAQKAISIKGRVLLNLLSHHNVKTGAWSGRATIAREVGTDERSVRRALHDLEAEDQIRRDGEYKGRALYRLPVGEKNQLLGGPDKWKIIEDLHPTVAHIRPQGGADLSGKVAHICPQGGADLSSPPGANSRQNHSGNSDKNTPNILNIYMNILNIHLQ